MWRSGQHRAGPPAPRLDVDYEVGIQIILPPSVTRGPSLVSSLPLFNEATDPLVTQPQEAEDGDSVERKGSLQIPQAESQHFGGLGLLTPLEPIPHPHPQEPEETACGKITA